MPWTCAACQELVGEDVAERHLLVGQSLAEIAQALGVQRNAVWERLHRGLGRVRAALDAAP